MLRWQFNWKITLFFVLMFPLLLSLGFWQLDREQQKSEWLEQRQRQQIQPPRPVQALDWSAPNLAHMPVRASGQYLAGRSFLLDNRVQDGRVGYEVITPLDTGERLLLVNRGWIAQGPSRADLPAVKAPEDSVVVTGMVHVPTGQVLLLSDRTAQQAGDWPRLIQRVDIDAMQAMLDRPTYPHTVRIDPDSPGALEPDWDAAVMQPAMHRGYAVQWFAMAAALLILFLYVSLTRDERADDNES